MTKFEQAVRTFLRENGITYSYKEKIGGKIVDFYLPISNFAIFIRDNKEIPARINGVKKIIKCRPKHILSKNWLAAMNGCSPYYLKTGEHPEEINLEDWLEKRAKEMRDNPTLEEKQFAKYLKAQGIEFQTQVPIIYKKGNIHKGYIADFLVGDTIYEIDGSAHNGREEYDKLRDDRLKELGYKVIRYKNQEVKNMDTNKFNYTTLTMTEDDFILYFAHLSMEDRGRLLTLLMCGEQLCAEHIIYEKLIPEILTRYDVETYLLAKERLITRSNKDEDCISFYYSQNDDNNFPANMTKWARSLKFKDSELEKYDNSKVFEEIEDDENLKNLRLRLLKKMEECRNESAAEKIKLEDELSLTEEDFNNIK